MHYPWLHTHRTWVAGFMPSAVHKHVPAPAACLPCLSGSRRCQRQSGTTQGNTLGARAEPRAEGWEVPVGWDSSDNTENTMVIRLTESANIVCITHKAFTLLLTTLKITYKHSLYSLTTSALISGNGPAAFLCFLLQSSCGNTNCLHLAAHCRSVSRPASVFQIPVTHLPLTICYYHHNRDARNHLLKGD